MLQSDSNGNRFNFTGGGATVNYLNVKDSNALTSDINALRSIDSGNTDTREGSPRWRFGTNTTAFIVEHN